MRVNIFKKRFIILILAGLKQNKREGAIMKKMSYLVLLISICMLVGCAMPYGPGFIISNYDFPACSPDDASGLQVGAKSGTSQMINYLGWIATGDASIATAAKNAGITKVKTVDVHFDTILGIISTTTTKVTGD
jgi:hypothetical protein